MASSTEQDRKRRTLPLQTHEAPQNGYSEGEVLDGELIDEDDRGQANQRRSRQPGQRTGSRDQSSSEREQKRNQAWDDRRERENQPPSAPVGSRPATGPQRLSDPMVRLRREIDEAGRKYMAEVRKADLLAAKKTPRERSLQLTGIHKGYVSMMVLSCIQPLGEGVNAKSVLSMVGMGSAMWMLSPNFRAQVGDFGAQMREAITEKIDERKQGQIDKVLTKAGAKTEAGQPLSQRWQKKLERAERAECGGRDVYTAQSAGMTEVALVENAYFSMRMEGADAAGIQDRLSSMLTDLYEHAHEDGVEASEIATAARVVVGLRLEEEPEFASVFSELAHGQFARSDAREVRISGTEETARVWTGEFESRLGQKIEAGSFGARGPMSHLEHQAAIADTMTADMVSLTRQHGVDGLNMGVVSYASAWGLKDRPDYGAMAAMDTPLGERLRTSRIMMHSMGADGLDSSEQQRIYSNAYVDAMENISAMYPEVEQEWAGKFGANWRQNMRDFVSNPEGYMGQQGGQSADQADPQGPTAWEAGPAKSPGPDGHTGAAASGKYRNARINQNYIETSKTGLTGMGSDPSDFRDQDFEMGG
jgi:hypothetical protein